MSLVTELLYIRVEVIIQIRETRINTIFGLYERGKYLILYFNALNTRPIKIQKKDGENLMRLKRDKVSGVNFYKFEYTKKRKEKTLSAVNGLITGY